MSVFLARLGEHTPVEPIRDERAQLPPVERILKSRVGGITGLSGRACVPRSRRVALEYSKKEATEGGISVARCAA